MGKWGMVYLDGEPWQYGYYFVGRLLDGNDYDLSRSVTSDITLTLKWVKSGETAVSVNHESFYVADLHEPAAVYLAAYKDDVLTDLWQMTLILIKGSHIWLNAF